MTDTTKTLSPDQVTAMLAFDPVAAAEKACTNLGLAGAASSVALLGTCMAHGQQKNAALLELGDTVLCNDLVRYLGIVQGLGFELACTFTFNRMHSLPNPIAADVKENLYVYANRETGCILVFDTYSYFDSSDGLEEPLLVVRVNSSKVHYVWSPNPEPHTDHYPSCLSSGGWRSPSNPDWGRNREELQPTDMVWFGDHDAREALVHKMTQLRTKGTLLPKWPNVPSARVSCLFVVGADFDQYRDMDFASRSAKIDQLSIARLELLPNWVKDIVNGNLRLRSVRPTFSSPS